MSDSNTWSRPTPRAQPHQTPCNHLSHGRLCKGVKGHDGSIHTLWKETGNQPPLAVWSAMVNWFDSDGRPEEQWRKEAADAAEASKRAAEAAGGRSQDLADAFAFLIGQTDQRHSFAAAISYSLLHLDEAGQTSTLVRMMGWDAGTVQQRAAKEICRVFRQAKAIGHRFDKEGVFK